MKIIILGNGFIASHFNHQIVKTKIADAQTIRNILDIHKPEVIINCIGYCGEPNIDACELNKEKTIFSNITVPLLLAQETKKNNIKLINISSGCIFAGTSKNIINQIDVGWKENDFANPQSYYSKCKYAADLATASFENICTLRIRMPVSEKHSERNFISKISKYKKLIDIENSMTLVSDLVRCVDWVIEKDKSGIYHCTNPGTTTAARTMIEYQKYVHDHEFNIINENELDAITLAKRSNCILNSDKLLNEGFEMQDITSGMKNCVKDYCLGV